VACTSGPFSRLAIFEAPIDALSMAAFEQLRRDTLYVATAGGMGPDTIVALQHLLEDLATQPAAIVVIGTDNDKPGERHAERLAALIEAANLRWERAKPPGGAKDWNKFLKIQAGKGDDE
jgi:predicted nuclease with TOPRIM domain